MNELELRELLEQVKAGNIGPDDALNSLRRLPFADLGHAKIDHHRNLRTGAPEAIYGPNKSPEQCVSIVGELLEHGSGPVLLPGEQRTNHRCNRSSPERDCCRCNSDLASRRSTTQQRRCRGSRHS